MSSPFPSSLSPLFSFLLLFLLFPLLLLLFSRLLADRLVRRLHHSRGPIVRFNVEIFKTLLSVAKGLGENGGGGGGVDVSVVPYDFIYALMMKEGAEQMTGGNSLAAALMEGYPPWPVALGGGGGGGGLEEAIRKRVNILTNPFRSKAKRTLDCFSGVSGMMLQSLRGGGGGGGGSAGGGDLILKVEDAVLTAVEAIGDEANFLRVLAGLSKEYPRLLARSSSSSSSFSSLSASSSSSSSSSTARRFALRVAGRLSHHYGESRLASLSILLRLPDDVLAELFHDFRPTLEAVCGKAVVDEPTSKVCFDLVRKLVSHCVGSGSGGSASTAASIAASFLTKLDKILEGMFDPDRFSFLPAETKLVCVDVAALFYQHAPTITTSSSTIAAATSTSTTLATTTSTTLATTTASLTSTTENKSRDRSARLLVKALADKDDDEVCTKRHPSIHPSIYLTHSIALNQSNKQIIDLI